MVTDIVGMKLKNCDLTVIFDSSYEESLLLEGILALPNLKQVITLNNESSSEDSLYNALWESSKCRGYFVLLQDPEPFIDFCEYAEDPWDYQGKYILIGFTRSQLDEVVSSKKGAKTQHIVGLTGERGEVKVLANQLFWGDGTVVANRWRNGGFASESDIFPDKTSDLKRANLTLITFNFAPHIVYAAEEGGRTIGRDILIAEAIAEVLNFTIKLKEPDDGALWGYKLANGSWTGMMGELANNIGHMGMANNFLSNINDRLGAVDFTRFYSSDITCFIVSANPPLPKWQSLAMPFQSETWLAILLGLLLLCPLLSAFAKMSASLDEELGGLQQFVYATLYAWGIHLRSSQPQLPRMTATKILVVFLWLYTIILTAGYSSNLTAFLTVERPHRGMETLQELHASSHDVLGMGYFFNLSLAASTNRYVKGLTRQYVSLSKFEDSYEPLLEGKAVFLESRTRLEYLIGTLFTIKGVPSLRIMRECYSPYSVAIQVQKHFPLTKSFDRVIAWLFESGHGRKWFLDTIRMDKKENRAQEDSQEEQTLMIEPNQRGTAGIPLGIDHMQGIFFILILGLSFATLVFVAELFMNQRQ